MCFIVLAGAAFFQAGNAASFADETSPKQPCVLLRNDNVVFGKAAQEGDFVIIRRGDGSQIRIGRKEVLCWAESVRDLYTYRIDHRVNGSASAHASDARWCLRHSLLNEAAAEITALRKIDPTSRQAEMLARQLAGARAGRSEIANQNVADQNMDDFQVEPRLAASVAVDDSPLKLVDHESPAYSIDIRMLHYFTSDVQPILMNRCGSCHSHDSARRWTILKPPRGVRTSARMSRENYVSTTAYVEKTNPEESELLRFALSPHGGVDAPLGPRNALAIEALRRWVRLVADKTHRENDQSDFAGSSKQTAGVAPASDPVGPSTWPNGPADQTNENVAPVSKSESNDGQLQRLPQVSNPFDPEIFNRKFHRASASGT